MRTLGLDTSHKHLMIACYEDDQIVASVCEKAWKKQSEHFFPALMQCMEQAGWRADDLDAVVLTSGPGSYTGERIAMTFAKVLCTTKEIACYTVTTFQMMAGKRNCAVIMDARSNRAYYGECVNGKLVHEEVKTLDEIQEIEAAGKSIVGDIDLLGHEYVQDDFASNLLDIKDAWEKVENVHTLVPHYLKNQEDLVS